MECPFCGTKMRRGIETKFRIATNDSSSLYYYICDICGYVAYFECERHDEFLKNPSSRK